jgi:hypothetical protein
VREIKPLEEQFVQIKVPLKYDLREPIGMGETENDSVGVMKRESRIMEKRMERYMGMGG